MNTLKTKSILTESYSLKKHVPVKTTKTNWNDDFKRTLFLSHGSTNCCGAAVDDDFNLYLDSLLESQSRNPIKKCWIKILSKWLGLKIPLNFEIFGGLEIPKSKDLLFSKIIGLTLFSIDYTFFCFKCFARVYPQNCCLSLVLQWSLTNFICFRYD